MTTTTNSGKNKGEGEDFYRIKVVTLDIDAIKAFEWSEELGARFKKIRGNVSRKELAQRVREKEDGCSEQYIQKIEDNRVAGLSRKILETLLEALGAELGQLFLLNEQILVIPKSRFTTNG